MWGENTGDLPCSGATRRTLGGSKGKSGTGNEKSYEKLGLDEKNGEKGPTS